MIKKHFLGSYSQDLPGPQILCMAGMHGNEHAGITAAQRVLKSLETLQTPFYGSISFFAGNLTALEKQQRFIDVDFNRIWSPSVGETVPGNNSSSKNEEIELRELLDEIHPVLTSSHESFYVIDLHTSSSHSRPFIVTPEYDASCSYLMKFQVPTILNTSQYIRGMFVEYMQRLGHCAFAFEGGQHDSPDSIDLLENAIWSTMRHSNAFQTGSIPADSLHISPLNSVPQQLKIVYRHQVHPGDGFRMVYHFENFTLLEKGKIIAEDQNGAIAVPTSGYLFMPLYQKWGEDGFFITEAWS